MLKLIKNLFLVGPKLTMEENNEFENSRKDLNINRCKTIAYFLLPLNIALILVDIFLYKPFRVYTPEYIYLFYSHVGIILLIILWLLVIEIIVPKSKKPKYTGMCHILVTIVIYWGVFLAINDIKISKHILAYIVCILALSIFIYLSPVEGFIQYFTSLLVLVIGLFLYAKDNKILYNNIVNGSIAMLCSYTALKVNYSVLKRDFLSKKVILRSKIELEASHLRLEEYEKLRTDFFANISHELRTPLNIIYGSQQMIENILSGKNKNNGNIDNYLNMIKQNSLRLTKLISNMIDMTKIDSTIYEIRPMNCDIIELIESISMSVAGYIESRNISLIFDTEVEEKIISCDPEKIERIMLNLLSNAIKFTDIDGSIFVNIYLNEDKVNISVRDNGIGIPNEMKELIFERFIQGDKSIDRNREGSGIGLSLVKSLVEMHNGSISVNSVLGQGSEFIVSLPDIVTNCNCGEEFSNSLENQRNERISIEFSDIYD